MERSVESVFIAGNSTCFSACFLAMKRERNEMEFMERIIFLYIGGVCLLFIFEGVGLFLFAYLRISALLVYLENIHTGQVLNN